MARRLRAASRRGFGGAQVGPRLGEIGGRGLEVAQRPGLALVQRAVLLLDDLGDRHPRLRPVDRGKSGEEIVLRLNHVGGFDVEQRLPALDHVARLGHQPGHPPGVGRKDRRGLVLVDRDLAFGHVLGAEGHRLDRLHAERCPLGRCRHKAGDAFGLAGHFSVRGAGHLGAAPVLRQQHKDDGSHRQDGHHGHRSRIAQHRPRVLREEHAQTSDLLPEKRRFCRVYSRYAFGE